MPPCDHVIQRRHRFGHARLESVVAAGKRVGGAGTGVDSSFDSGEGCVDAPAGGAGLHHG